MRHKAPGKAAEKRPEDSRRWTAACGIAAAVRKSAGALRHRALAAVLLTMIVMPLCTGCASRARAEELQSYAEAMSTFCGGIADARGEIEGIDAASDTAGQELLDAVDAMAGSYMDAAAVEAPDGYERAGSLCRQASGYMQKAREEFHTALESDPFNQAVYQTAEDDFERAGSCTEEMLLALQQGGGNS